MIEMGEMGEMGELERKTEWELLQRGGDGLFWFIILCIVYS